MLEENIWGLWGWGEYQSSKTKAQNNKKGETTRKVASKVEQ
jgi:hypothetical protein